MVTQQELQSCLWEAANILRGTPADRTDWKGVGCHYSRAGPWASLLPQGHRAPGGPRGSIGQGRTRHCGVGSEVCGPRSVWRVFPQECVDGRRSRRAACVRVAGFAVGIPNLQQARPVASVSASAEMSAGPDSEPVGRQYSIRR